MTDLWDGPCERTPCFFILLERPWELALPAADFCHNHEFTMQPASTHAFRLGLRSGPSSSEARHPQGNSSSWQISHSAPAQVGVVKTPPMIKPRETLVISRDYWDR